MEIEQSTITKLKLTKLENLDPVTVYIDDIEPGKGKITIECYGKSWSTCWGGMSGQTIAEFLASSGVDYVANCLWDHSQPQTELNYYGMQKIVREKVLDSRRDGCMDKDFAREMYDIENWENYAPEHTYDTWHCPEFSDKSEFEDLCLDEIDIPEKLTHNYDYLNRIVLAVQESLQSLIKQKAA